MEIEKRDSFEKAQESARRMRKTEALSTRARCLAGFRCRTLGQRWSSSWRSLPDNLLKPTLQGTFLEISRVLTNPEDRKPSSILLSSTLLSSALDDNIDPPKRCRLQSLYNFFRPNARYRIVWHRRCKTGSRCAKKSKNRIDGAIGIDAFQSGSIPPDFGSNDSSIDLRFALISSPTTLDFDFEGQRSSRGTRDFEP